MEKEKEKANETQLNDAMNEAQGRVDDMFWIWKRAMGEDMNFTLGADGKGPNHGGKHFGAAFDRNKTNSGIILP
jgi:hypothetical protein